MGLWWWWRAGTVLGADAAGHVSRAAGATSASSAAVAVVVRIGSVHLAPGVPLRIPYEGVFVFLCFGI